MNFHHFKDQGLCDRLGAMNPSTSFISREFRALFQMRSSERLWHIPLLASLCCGIPLVVGLAFGHLEAGLISCLAGLVILYLPIAGVAQRMVTVLVCGFGFMISFLVGLIFSFDPIISSLVFGLFAVFIHWVSLFFKMKPPGSFFFIMLAAVASCMPFDFGAIPFKLGLVGLGTMNACLLALGYSLLMMRKHQYIPLAKPEDRSANLTENWIEAGILGFFMFASMLLGHWLQLKNPYWIPVSCAAVMQGASTYHIWQRSFYRILGTLIGVGLCWVILSITKNAWSICIAIIILQFVIEMLIVRHYALAVVFITPMTILLTEAGNPLIHNPEVLVPIRFWNIALGSLIGALGGWVIYNERIRFIAKGREKLESGKA